MRAIMKVVTPPRWNDDLFEAPLVALGDHGFLGVRIYPGYRGRNPSKLRPRLAPKRAEVSSAPCAVEDIHDVPRRGPYRRWAALLQPSRMPMTSIAPCMPGALARALARIASKLSESWSGRRESVRSLTTGSV